MLKFRVKDEDGEEYMVEPVEVAEEAEVDEDFHDEEPSPFEERIAALEAKIAEIEAKLAELSPEKPEEGLEDEEFEEEKEEEFVDSEEAEEKEEEIVDTCAEDEKKMKKDSKNSFGSLEKVKNTDSKNLENQEEIAQAWAKRYKGGNQ